jgi:hypothetical protein
MRMSALTGAVNDAVSSTPSRFTVLNPGKVNVTVYTPGRRSTILYWPLVGGDGARLLDQRGTARLNGHAGQHTAGRIPDDAGNRALRRRSCWDQESNQHQPDGLSEKPHAPSSKKPTIA